MFYKVIKNGKTIDILRQLLFLKYDEKLKIMLNCEEKEAQAILSSDCEYFWNIPCFKKPPIDIDTVELEEISLEEYNRLKVMHLMTPEEIIDQYTLSLIEGGIL